MIRFARQLPRRDYEISTHAKEVRRALPERQRPRPPRRPRPRRPRSTDLDSNPFQTPRHLGGAFFVWRLRSRRLPTIRQISLQRFVDAGGFRLRCLGIAAVVDDVVSVAKA